MKFTFPISTFLLCGSLVAFAPHYAAGASDTQRSVQYQEGATILEGYMMTPPVIGKGGKTPVVIVVHEWMGIDSYIMARLKMLTQMGYVAFAADIYGKGMKPGNAEDAGKLSGKYKNDLPLLRKRIRAAIDTAISLPGADPSRIAIIGYCFGGTVALEAARANMPIVAAVSFHGGLGTLNPKETKNVKAKVAVFHGADDPLVPPAEVKAFEDEMRAAKADWQLTSYGGAVHKFSNYEVPHTPGAAFGYNESADKRSWVAMNNLFAEIFKMNKSGRN